MPSYLIEYGLSDIARAAAIELDRRKTKHVFSWRWVALLVVEILRLRAQLKAAQDENKLLWKAIKETK